MASHRRQPAVYVPVIHENRIVDIDQHGHNVEQRAHIFARNCFVGALLMVAIVAGDKHLEHHDRPQPDPSIELTNNQ